MNKLEKDWPEEVINSMHGSKRAKPSPALFAQIEQSLGEQVKIIPISYWKWIAAAAVLLIVINLSGFKQIGEINSTGEYSQSVYETSLISNYNIYE